MARLERFPAVLLAMLALAACAGSRSTPTSRDTATTSSASSTTEADHGAIPEAAPAPSAPVETGPAPELGLRATPDRSGRPISLVVENRGDSLARVAPTLRLERAGADGRFAPVDGVRLALRPDCEHPAASCVELAPGAALHPPAWLGTAGDAQCACEGCAPAEPGRYRVVATSCGGAHRVEGEPFELR